MLSDQGDSRLKRALGGEGIAVGAMLYEFDTSGVTRILEAAGADFALFDLEHTGWDAGSMRSVLAAARADEVTTIVRVIRSHYHLVASGLDAGADGVMAPMVETGAEARDLVAAAKYPPLGRRGFGVLYSDALAEGAAAIVERVNREGIVIAQVESALGIENADEIAATEGVDVVWLGHFDLSCSLGHPGEFDHPDFIAAVGRLSVACERQGKPLGQMIFDADEGAALSEQGFRVFALGDIWLFERAMRDQFAALRGAVRAA